MDFSRFVISGPSTSTVSVGKLLAGKVKFLQKIRKKLQIFLKIFFLKLLAGAAAGKEAATATQCLTDTFSVTNPRFGIFLLKYYVLYRYLYLHFL